MRGSRPVLVLCAGTQSSGSTLVSWCFLQRRDMNGYLDADNDILHTIPKHLGQPFVWYKTTLSSFRLSELIRHYEDEDWEVRPLLILRDVRAVFGSLAGKPYGQNGTTAEDPPLRLRLRRFREDWERGQRLDIPMLRYEDFVSHPTKALQEICEKLLLPWDEGMIHWPKPFGQIHDTRHGNATFLRNRGNELLTSLQPLPEHPDIRRIAPGDLAWLESEFAEFNRVNGYPLQMPHSSNGDVCERSVPRYDVTRRHKWTLHQRPLRYLAYRARQWVQRGWGKAG